jgi:hypothetical protein
MNKPLKKKDDKMKRVPKKKGWIEYDFTKNSN